MELERRSFAGRHPTALDRARGRVRPGGSGRVHGGTDPAARADAVERVPAWPAR
jgi:hypothetical protein